MIDKNKEDMQKMVEQFFKTEEGKKLIGDFLSEVLEVFSESMKETIEEMKKDFK